MRKTLASRVRPRVPQARELSYGDAVLGPREDREVAAGPAVDPLRRHGGGGQRDGGAGL